VKVRPLPPRFAADGLLGWLLIAIGLAAGCSGHTANRPAATAGGPLLVAVAEANDVSQIRLFDPRSGQAVRTVASVQHRPGWGLTASVGPSGEQLAYVVLPVGAVDPDTQGELWLLPLAGRSARRLATGVDLRSDLTWSPDGSWVSYAKVNAPSIDLRRVNVSGAGDQSLAVSGAADRWYQFGYAADDRSLELAHVTNSGTTFARATPGASPATEAPITPGSSRDFTLAPDGRAALLALVTENGKPVYRALVRRLDGSFARLTAGGEEDTGIAWNPRSGEATVGVVPEAAGQPVPATAGAQTLVPASGFDVPVAWSRDGALLAVRHFSGASTDTPGEETVLVVRGTQRLPLQSAVPLTIAGWTP